MNNQDLIDKYPQQDDIEGWNLQKYKKNLRKKRVVFDNDPCFDVVIESEHGDWGDRD
jgi:hypothetical protein